MASRRLIQEHLGFPQVLFLFTSATIVLINQLFMKKILFSVSILALLAAGCGSASQNSSSSNTTNSTKQTTLNPSPSPSSLGSGNQGTTTGSTWQGILMASNNSAKGNYMLSANGHTIYLHTSRDYSALVGKSVNVGYSGTMDSFSLDDITAQ
jgi:hypothetical protein